MPQQRRAQLVPQMAAVARQSNGSSRHTPSAALRMLRIQLLKQQLAGTTCIRLAETTTLISRPTAAKQRHWRNAKQIAWPIQCAEELRSPATQPTPATTQDALSCTLAPTEGVGLGLVGTSRRTARSGSTRRHLGRWLSNNKYHRTR